MAIKCTDAEDLTEYSLFSSPPSATAMGCTWPRHGRQPHRDSLSVQIGVVCFDWWVGVGLVLGGILGGRPIRRPLKFCILNFLYRNLGFKTYVTIQNLCPGASAAAAPFSTQYTPTEHTGRHASRHRRRGPRYRYGLYPRTPRPRCERPGAVLRFNFRRLASVSGRAPRTDVSRVVTNWTLHTALPPHAADVAPPGLR